MAELVRGGVTDRPWGRTFAALGLRGVTGQLTVVSDGKRFQVAFDRGAVVAAASPMAADAAVRVALTGHLVSSSQVPEISRRQAASPDRDEVAVIAELARLGPDHTLRLRRRVIAQRAARTFSLNQGEFVVTDRIEQRVLPGCELDVRAVIYMGARTNLSEPRLAAELDQLGAWFRLRPGLDDELPQFGFGDLEQPVVERLRDGGAIEELEEFAASFVDARTVRAVVYSLAVYNACDVIAGPAPRRRAATPAPEADEPSGGEPQPARSSPTQPMQRVAAEGGRPTPPAGAPVAPRARTASPYMNTSPMPTIAPSGAADEPGRPAPASGSDPALRRPPADERDTPGRARTGSDPALRRPPPDERDTPGRARSGSDPALRRPPADVRDPSSRTRPSATIRVPSDDERDSASRTPTGSQAAVRVPPDDVRDPSSRARTSATIRVPSDAERDSASRTPTGSQAAVRLPPDDVRDTSSRTRSSATIRVPSDDQRDSASRTPTGSQAAVRLPPDDVRDTSSRTPTGSRAAVRVPPDDVRDPASRARTSATMRVPSDDERDSASRARTSATMRVPSDDERDSASRTRTSATMRVPSDEEAPESVPRRRAASSNPSVRLPSESELRDGSTRGRLGSSAGLRVPSDEGTPESVPRRRAASSDPSVRLPSESELRDDSTRGRLGSSAGLRVPPDEMTPESMPRFSEAGREPSSDSSRRRQATVEASQQVVVRRIASRPPPTRRIARGDTAQSHEVKALIAQRLKLLDQGADHFALLGVAQDVPSDGLRKAYFALARQLHPDRLAALGISDDGRHAQRLFAQINTGFAVLSDAGRRAEYVSVLRRGGEAAVHAEQSRAEDLARRILEAEEAFRRGELALRRDQPQVAVAELEAAVQLNPDEADYHAALAWSQFCAASDKAAIAQRTRTQLERAIQRAPKAMTALFYLGRVERMLGRDHDALRHFRDVLTALPGHTEAASEIRVLEAKLTGGDKPGGFFGRKK